MKSLILDDSVSPRTWHVPPGLEGELMGRGLSAEQSREFLAGVRASLKGFDRGDPGQPWAEVKKELGL